MSKSTGLDLLDKSCSELSIFPENIKCPLTPQYHLVAYQKKLKDREPYLFCQDGSATLDILEYDDNTKEFQNTCITNVHDLKDRLEGTPMHSRKDPRCRFVFPIALHSRDRLRISKEMFAAAFTHHQVMLPFLDFVFPFGMQEYLEDFYFSGLREETRLSSSSSQLNISELGRSGQEIRLCYNLKSVERSSDKHWPWSIRQTAVYHSFDLLHGKAFWIILKGNKLMKQRIQSSTATGAVGTSDLRRFESNSEAFASSLAIHLVLADWCGEHWRWYLNYLEERLHAATRSTAAIITDREPSLYELPVHHNYRSSTTPSVVNRVATIVKKTFSKKFNHSNSGPGILLSNIPVQTPFPMTAGPPAPPVLPPGLPGSVPKPTENKRAQDEQEDFTLKDLKEVQHIEEKANEVSPVLAANIDILRELTDHYKEVLGSDDCPIELRDRTQVSFKLFEKRIKSIITDLERQKSRMQILLGLLSNRKNMLYEISNKRAIETSRIYAKRAQLSTDRMEKMTDAMFEIAKKTQEETVSMKIITLVTLFFLPGTFISTIMSTDIIQFQENKKQYSSGALKLYVLITIPFMLLTFGTWWGLGWWKRREERKKSEEIDDLEKQKDQQTQVEILKPLS